ncbi:hypothetical protein B0H13DRAFT_1850141 [Mycena leptocephala]|nr:hypothetical protein B0H13DRAFT_1850141 [Mycena leptocephala]
MQMNAHDKSGYGWAYILDNGVIVWDEKLTPADADSFCVLDHEITTERILAKDEVAVSLAYYENAERLIQQAHHRETKWWKIRQSKKLSRQHDTGLDIHSTEARDKFANKRKELEAAAAQAEAAARQKENDGGAGEDGATPNASGSNGMDTSVN